MQTKKHRSNDLVFFKRYGRDDRIRTCDPLVPNQVLYQAEPHPAVATLLIYHELHCQSIIFLFFIKAIQIFFLDTYIATVDHKLSPSGVLRESQDYESTEVRSHPFKSFPIYFNHWDSESCDYLTQVVGHG